MHIKFLSVGRSGRRAVSYLLRKRGDEQVIVRRGTPRLFGLVVDELKQQHRYSSAVIAFAPEDCPTEEQIEEVLEAFQQTAWPGIEERDICFLAVEHRKKNGKGTHIHFLIARHHLGVRKSFNPAPPGWQKRYDSLRDYFNAKYNWGRPEDPVRARKVQPGYLAFPGVAAEKRQVVAWAEALFGLGVPVEEVIELAKASGAEVPRRGENYITVAWGRQRVRIRLGEGREKEKKEERETAEERWQKQIEFWREENKRRYGGNETADKTAGAIRNYLPGMALGGLADNSQGYPGVGLDPGFGFGSGAGVLFDSEGMGLGRRPERRVSNRVQRPRRIKADGGEMSHGHKKRIRWALVENGEAAEHGNSGDTGTTPSPGGINPGFGGEAIRIRSEFERLQGTLTAIFDKFLEGAERAIGIARRIHAVAAEAEERLILLKRKADM